MNFQRVLKLCAFRRKKSICRHESIRSRVTTEKKLFQESSYIINFFCEFPVSVTVSLALLSATWPPHKDDKFPCWTFDITIAVPVNSLALVLVLLLQL